MACVRRAASELHRTLRRMELQELFRPGSDRVQDLATYADIALDLGQPAMASLVLWHIAPLTKDEAVARERLELFLYGLEKLGVTDIKTNFKGDHSRAFEEIDARRREAFKRSAASQVMAEDK